MRGIYTEFLTARLTPNDMAILRQWQRKTGARSRTEALRLALRALSGKNYTKENTHE